jgi:hypothetical protein
VPLDWAATQNSLGDALGALGERESDPVKLEEATRAFREALQEWTRERVPLQWAHTQENLASAYGVLFAITHEPHYLDDALTAVGGALEEYRNANAAYDIETAERLRGKIIVAKGSL